MGKLLIIGCGGVAQVAITKCCQNSKTFSEICVASRTKSKCDALKEKLQKTTETVITTAQVDADKTEEVIALIKEYQPDAVLNVALPYQDLTIMDACLACKVDYIDTANYEPVDDTMTYRYREEKGFIASVVIDNKTFTGRQLKALNAREFPDADTLRAAKRFTRMALKPYLGGKPLKSRELFRQFMPKRTVKTHYE